MKEEATHIMPYKKENGITSGLSLESLFYLVMEVLTQDIKMIIPNCMLFAYCIVLFEKSREEVNSKLEFWRQTLESRGFLLNRSKTKYMHSNFSKK